MATQNIDTFEYDIADEIKRKEASVGDIASATGDIGNSPEEKTSSIMPIIISVLLIAVALGALYFGYIYYEKKVNPTQNKLPTETTITKDTSLLSTLSPLFPDSFGRFVDNVKRTEYGYIISINSYSPVFAYMLKNENLYADDLARAVGSARDTSTSTPPFNFTDITINNQNMRIGTSLFGATPNTIVYAFINTTDLVVASTTEGVLALRNVILH